MADQPKVLLVDDDVGFLTANSLLLKEAGCEVFTAEDGQAGLAAAMEHKPDVVVIDVIMRRPDEGFVLARAIRAEPSLAGIRLLVVTAAGERYGMMFEPDDQWLPVDKVLEKPTTGDELVREITALLARPEENAEERT